MMKSTTPRKYRLRKLSSYTRPPSNTTLRDLALSSKLRKLTRPSSNQKSSSTPNRCPSSVAVRSMATQISTCCSKRTSMPAQSRQQVAQTRRPTHSPKYFISRTKITASSCWKRSTMSSAPLNCRPQPATRYKCSQKLWIKMIRIWTCGRGPRQWLR
ncbi:uncharacterized protein BKA78DRAFT_302785 [Phyllosticta capitalensis]|uniref:uncharacterized protein n=1 Tax=Phyllosticta capitalensis TaxID=121624 RepID=UPI0031327C1B